MTDAATAPSRDGPRETSLRGRRLVVTDDKPTFWDKAAAGAWEPELLALLEAQVSPGTVFLDIGAWVGPTALFAALLGAEVVAVEADPAAADRLAGNLDANPALAPRVRILRRAASPRPGHVRLGAARKPGDSMSSVLHAGRQGSWEVETATPAALVEAAREAGCGPLVVKVDIEGGEYALLPALFAALPAATRAVIAAFHPGLLRKAGQDEAEIARATGACFAGLAGWDAAVLDADGRAGAEKAALSGNCTIVFTRAGST
ncbi:MAG: FkbM family methyltransferase [Alsobacter sp.]